jgi:general stress protein 26
MANQLNQKGARDREDHTTKTPEDIVALARSFDTAMLVTHGADGSSRARPMSVGKVEDDARLWFITSTTNDLVTELARDPRALVVMQGRLVYLCIEGEASTHHDRAKVAELWSEPMRVWFQDANDPNILLLGIPPHRRRVLGHGRRQGHQAGVPRGQGRDEREADAGRRLGGEPR